MATHTHTDTHSRLKIKSFSSVPVWELKKGGGDAARHWPVLRVLGGCHCDERGGILHGIKVLSILIFITRLFLLQPLTPFLAETFRSQCAQHGGKTAASPQSGGSALRRVRDRAACNRIRTAMNQGIIRLVKLSMFQQVNQPEGCKYFWVCF